MGRLAAHSGGRGERGWPLGRQSLAGQRLRLSCSWRWHAHACLHAGQTRAISQPATGRAAHRSAVQRSTAQRSTAQCSAAQRSAAHAHTRPCPAPHPTRIAVVCPAHASHPAPRQPSNALLPPVNPTPILSLPPAAQPPTHLPQVPFSEFVRRVKHGDVRSVAIDGVSINFALKPNALQLPGAEARCAAAPHPPPHPGSG
jgi:hypothetical protein